MRLRGHNSTNAQQAVWQYGGATNICSAFCSLIGFSSSRRITPGIRINNELLFINLAAVTDDFQIPPHRQAVSVVRHQTETINNETNP